ncbi:MAG TPA: hypothetical protein VK357_10375 [Rubrobacteraceae bacterium]|jgi:hypothetical protein|nr:hypothetical protein [Rubrobacteraceae bacterium]
MTDDDLERNAEGRGEEGYEWGEELDLTSISEEELRARVNELAEEEREISYRRRVIQGRIDLTRSELVWRGGVTGSPEELARVLLGEGRAEARRGIRGETQGEDVGPLPPPGPSAPREDV